MTAITTIHYKDRLSLTTEEIVAGLPTFPSKKAAIEAGKAYGWREAVKIRRRFESVWVVGKKDFQNDEVAGVDAEVFRFPMLTFVDGAQPVIKVRRFKA